VHGIAEVVVIKIMSAYKTILMPLKINDIRTASSAIAQRRCRGGQLWSKVEDDILQTIGPSSTTLRNRPQSYRL